MKILLWSECTKIGDEPTQLFIPFGCWPYDGRINQQLNREGAEKIAAQIAEAVRENGFGLPIYQGHPDVPKVAAKYPDKAAIGWIKGAEITEKGLALKVEWVRWQKKGFSHFSPFWSGEEKDNLVDVNHLISIGLVNNPRVSEFRLPNEAEEGKNQMNRKDIIKLLGLADTATDEEIKAAIAEILAKASTAVEDACKAQQDAKAANEALEKANAENDELRKSLENERAEVAKLRALKTKSVTTDLPNETAETVGNRLELVNGIMRERGICFTAAWEVAKTQKPELFK